MNEDLDRLLAYRNFLAAEDHLDELLYSPSSSEEYDFLTGLKNEIEYLRDDVMPKETNKDYHCVVKHLSTAYEACREVAKATHEELDINRANACRGLLNTALEKLWGRKIITCERCKDGRIQEESSRDSTEAFDDGFAGRGVQGNSTDRIFGLSSSEGSGNSGSETDGTEPDLTGQEGGAPF
jgi:hypothetical protein